MQKIGDGAIALDTPLDYNYIVCRDRKYKNKRIEWRCKFNSKCIGNFLKNKTIPPPKRGKTFL